MQLPALLQRTAGGKAGRRMTTLTAPRLRDAADLAAVLGVPYTDEQLAAITAPLEPVAIVAGAGSGKTTVMAARVVWLVGTGQVPPEAVLGLTFTNKAAGELAQRIRGALERARVLAARDDTGEPAVATYHSYAGQLIGEHGLRIGVEPHARLLADASRYQVAARAIRRAPGPFHALTKPIGMLIEDVLALDGEMSEHLTSVADVRAHDRELIERLSGDGDGRAVRKAVEAATKRLELCSLVEAYRAAKRERDLVDFGDQMALAATLAQTCPEVGAGERERYRVVLLDEYQDTSVAQRRMLVGLFGGGHPVTAVGDPCQAIYGWRGASVANLDDFPRHFRASDGREATRLSLRENRRSGETILDFANALAAPLHEVHAGVRPLRPAPSARGAGEVRYGLFETYADELRWVADEVCRAIDDGTPLREIAVLVRVTRDVASVHAALTARDIPVEVVGLGGLVHLPEVADVIATLEVLDDATANAALVRLLTGPRWRIGQRDLALLGRRAADLVRVPPAEPGDADAALGAAVAGVDPAEVVSLSDALAAPGPLPYSAAARDRFAALEAELRELRRVVGEPLLDLLHRVLTVTGLDVEIAASPHALAARRRDSLSAFLDVAAGFEDVEGDTSVAAFLAYLRAAEEHERGLDSTAPTSANSVKLLTAHKAKGLEWDVVLLPDLTTSVFPSTRGRERWTTVGHALPYPLRGDRDSLPGVGEWTTGGFQAFEQAVRDLAEREELRLGYVACTRPRRRLVASSHWWGPTQKRRRGPSSYLLALREFCESRGLELGPWAEPPADDAVNPQLGVVEHIPWPRPLDPVAHRLRAEAADAVCAAMGSAGTLVPSELTPEEAVRVAQWDRDIELLLSELRRGREVSRVVELPASLSATQLLKLSADPDGLARELARPMPRPPAPQARRGTRFHAWVETLFAQQPLLEPDDLPGAADHDIVDEADLEVLKQSFLRTPYAERRPYAIEAPFQLAVAGRVVRGRIDAVYETGDGFEVVDWKTNRRATADPLQLAIYRLAWAEIAGVPVEQVSAAFLYVRTGEVVRPADLPGRADLERLLGPQPNNTQTP
jgi:DNA helicase-2/ATP-dependent DNA helicase PcrA